jgi:hypothetical protein
MYVQLYTFKQRRGNIEELYSASENAEKMMK